MPEGAREASDTRLFSLITEGTVVSHYTILERIASGGMGEVYLAEDTELTRPVALKFMPSESVTDEDFKERFIREAKATAALIHPGIVTIHEVNEYYGRPYIVMEHVEGQSLKHVLRDIELPVTEILNLAVQICEGLRKAHQAGIIHRDIKPANIIIDSEGRPKLLDFGLASIEGESKLTKTGSALGTVGYMSPEQLGGQVADERSDIFSFGLVLYEMLAGRSPFKRGNDASTLQALLNETPEPIARYKSNPPEGLQRIIDKTLEKKRELRYQHVDDLLADLKREAEALSQPSGKLATIEAPPSKVKALWIVAGVVAAVILMTSLLTLSKKKSALPAAIDWKRITFFSNASSAAISPNGMHIAYVRGRGLEQRRVMVQDLSGGQPMQLFEDQAVTDLRWAPDGSELLFKAGNDSVWGACLVPRHGGTFRRYPFGGVSGSYSLAWSPDGSLFAVATPRKKIRFADRESGEFSPASVDVPFERMDCLDWSPNGDLMLFRTPSPGDLAIWTVRVDGRILTRAIAAEVSAPRWSPQGDAIYYLQKRGEVEDLMKLPVDPHLGTPLGKPMLVLAGLQTDGFISLSNDAKRLLFVKDLSPANLWLVDLKSSPGKCGVKTKQLTSGTAEILSPSISPDGRRVAFAVSSGVEQHIFTMPIEGGDRKQLTQTHRQNRCPAWSPNGRQIAFSVFDGEAYRVAIINANGGIQRTFSSSNPAGPLTWSPGARVLYQQTENRGYRILDPRTGQETPLVPNDSLGGMFDAQYCPHGHRVAVDWNRFVIDTHGKWVNAGGLWVISLGNASQSLLSRGRFFYLFGWSADGDWIYTRGKEKPLICRVPATGGEIDTVVTLPFDDVASIAMTSDGRRFVCAVGEQQSDIWLVENFDSDQQ